jgi:hypothetical protein
MDFLEGNVRSFLPVLLAVVLVCAGTLTAYLTLGGGAGPAVVTTRPEAAAGEGAGIAPNSPPVRPPTDTESRPGGAEERGESLTGLGSEDPEAHLRAVERIAGLPWESRFTLLRNGLLHPNPGTALACAWVLDWKYLSADELDKKAEILIPHCRRLWDDPFPGLDDLAEEGDEYGWDGFAETLGFATTARMLARFPSPPGGELEDTVRGLFTYTHRTMLAEHIPFLVALTAREDPKLVQEAFHQALFLSGYKKGYFAELGETIRRLNPCASRYDGEDNPCGFGGKALPLPARIGDLPPLFVWPG